MITVNESGVLKTLGEISANDGGVLKKLNTVHANDGGVLKKIFESSKPLSDYSVGDVVKIKESGTAVDFIIGHKGKPSSLYDSSCDGVWLVRKTLLPERQFDENYNDYENSDIEEWLNGTYLNTIDSAIRAKIKQVKIPYKKGKGNNTYEGYEVQTGTNGLSCKVFLLSCYEVGFTTADQSRIFVDGAKLSYFSSNSRRIAKDSSGTANSWWLRTPDANNGYGIWVVDTGGTPAADPTGEGWEPNLARPAFIVPSTVKVDKNGYLTV